MSKAYFVCGTGTNIGKSVVCAGLLSNISFAKALKIIQTGEKLFDQNLYTEACPQSRSKTLYHFKMSASPHLAAKAENQVIDLSLLAQEVHTEVLSAELTLLEGSGGIMTPLSETNTFLDFMVALEYPVILVIANMLGSINHALLSIDTLKRTGLKIKGLIFTHPDAGYKEDHPISIDNMDIIKKQSQVDILGVVPYIYEVSQESSRKEVWSEVAACLKKAAIHLTKPCQKDEPISQVISSFDHNHLWHPYSSAPGMGSQNWLVAKTAGHYIYLKNGHKLLDGMSSWWCAIHGYGRPELAAALNRQARIMSHVMFGGLTHEPAVELGQSLLKILPSGLEKIFWVDSGSVAVEVALKMAVQYWQECGFPKKIKTISHYGGYHGDTLGAMSVGDPINGMHAQFGEFMPEQIFVPRPAIPFYASFDENSLSALAETVEKHHQECAAVIVEPIVQGAGGMWIYHPDYLKGVKEICCRYDLLLIYDEIATGFGRTGKMFATEWTEANPDIMCLGKALTGGTMTLAAAICTAAVAEGISRNSASLMHGPTFMGNPLACSVALASLSLLQSSDWARQVDSIQHAFEKGLAECRKASEVKDVRVLGAIGVVEMNRLVNVSRLCKYFAEKHDVWIRPFNNLIYIMPAYTVTSDECARLSRAISQAVEGKEWI